MGVVRDVTIDNLTQAVQGISSTGISDSTGQSINNTLGTLGKDTSLQGIINAINALGQLLGSDKANISGDNIADKAIFRANIGLQIDTFSFNGSANNWHEIATDCPLNNYIPLSIIGSSLSRSGWIYNFIYDSNTSSTYWAVSITSSLGSTPSGTYSGRFLALKIN